MFLQDFPPMGVYETLFKFQKATGYYMGDQGTHPWAQGFPLTHQLPGGPELPGSVEFDSSDLKYPTATGVQPLREALARYYNHFYGAQIDADNVAVFAGGRPAIFATLLFLQRDIRVLIEETEYTPYFDKLRLLNREHHIIPSNSKNRFRPQLHDYLEARKEVQGRTFIVKSNPCNPTGVTWTGDNLANLVAFIQHENHGGLFDEAYEFFNATGPVSALQYIKNIDETNIFVVGAATKGLQAPGMRVGWVVASKRHIEIFRNFSSIAMGGVSRPSQIYVTRLLELGRVTQAREAVTRFYNEQRTRYRDALTTLGIDLYTGDGGFYHWGRLPGTLTADQFNERLFGHRAAILPGTLCDMHRRGDAGEHKHFLRFSFGPLEPGSFDANLGILAACLG
jgi:aspartate/methionine/tyrosine aminotransferase